MIGYTRQYGAEEAKQMVDRVFSTVDMDKDGEISFNEFATASVRRDKLLTDEKLKRAFKLWDKDGNGVIDANEIESVIGVGK